ncbi:hypothetical protein LEP1GSC088_3321 [Leptospira interrogans str. L1207]|nr:hypothetical protein LEP1GSC088_3321 [Leptospira interrogans str. L1207]
MFRKMIKHNFFFSFQTCSSNLLFISYIGALSSIIIFKNS